MPNETDSEHDGNEYEPDILEGASVVPAPTRELLNEQQYIDYRGHRIELIQWLANLGKKPDHGKGYSEDVVKRRAGDIDRFYRWTWDSRTDGYTTSVTTSHADAYCQKLAMGDSSEANKKNIQLSLKSLFKWKGTEWEPSITFTGESGTSQPRDYLTRQERGKLREAVLDWDSIPAYYGMSPEERQRWKQHIARRIGKATSSVSPEDFEQVNGFKYASLVHTALDTGLRPIEVGRAKTYWVDIDNAVLRIPKEESSKNEGNWIVSIRERTADMLERWLQEREMHPQYEGNDQLWLTRNGNPYNASALRYVMNKLIDLADIDESGRSLSFYAIRHSVGTYMAREEGLAAASSQLRHHSIRTSAKYDQTPVEDRREALENMDR